MASGVAREVRILLIGEPVVEADGHPVALPRGRPLALLAWLALNPGRHRRAAVATRFWPDILDESARASLRTAVEPAHGAGDRGGRRRLDARARRHRRAGRAGARRAGRRGGRHRQDPRVGPRWSARSAPASSPRTRPSPATSASSTTSCARRSPAGSAAYGDAIALCNRALAVLPDDDPRRRRLLARRAVDYLSLEHLLWTRLHGVRAAG